ncbi:MAG: sigma-70 family RNA polymerase sigma factor [bacterium]|nr:sigma-70 family RNA polymerase sigma factor [bacterium]
MSHRERKTDHALLRQLCGPDGDWETFVATYYPQVERIAAKKLRNPDEAQDVAQDVMMKLVWRLRKGWRNDPSKGGFQALLNVVIEQRVRDHWRRKERQLRYTDELPADIELEKGLQWLKGGSEPPVVDELAGEPSEDLRLMQGALDELTEADRLVLTYDSTGSELAKALNKKPGAVRVQKFRAMKRLREALRERMVRWQTERGPSLTGRFALEHLIWAGQLILDQRRGTGSGPALLFRRQEPERTVESIPLESCTDVSRDTFADLEPPVFDRKVSGRHCRIESLGDSWLIEDRGSTNGTLVNDERLIEGHPVELRDGDRLEIGRQLLVFSAGEPALEEAP